MSESKKLEISPSVAIIIAGIIIAGAVVFTKSAASPQANGGAQLPAGTPTQMDLRPPMSADHYYGSANAEVVLIEYSDFQCPFCSMIHSTLKTVVDNSNGKVGWIYRHLPLTSIHSEATPAANASECIAAQLGNAGFWGYADAVFANQANLSTSFSAQIAQQLGVDMQKYNVCVASKAYQKVIDTDTLEAGNLGGTGTPFTVVLNTKTKKAVPVSGAVPQAQLEAVIKSVQ